MPATIYLSPAAFNTAQAIKDLDCYERLELIDHDPAYVRRHGYYLKNASKLNVELLPDGAEVVPYVDIASSVKVSLPSHLRGCVFEAAPALPSSYAEIVSFWSGDPLNLNVAGAVYFQNPQNEYMVNLGPKPVLAPVLTDRLLSEGVVVAVEGLASLASGASGLSAETFIEVRVEFDRSALGPDPAAFLAGAQGEGGGGGGDLAHELIYLKVADVLRSPDADRIYIDLLRHELLDYGYWY